MSPKRRQPSAKFKFRVALEAVKEKQTISELASQYAVHPTRGRSWKKQLVSGGAGMFPHGNKESKDEPKIAETELDEQIGRRKMKLE